ncbi:MAG TPA: glycoside hydrolase family 172 protein [Tepidisphaeraceae bacterium]
MSVHIRWGSLLCLVSLIAGCASHEPVATPFTSPLATVALAHEGEAMHQGSWDRTGGNGDCLQVAPGQTVTLLDYQGAGIIRRFWVTIAPRAEMHIHSQAILRMYWDDEKEPSVECPIGAFFGVGFGQQKDYVSLPLNEMSGGYNCYWPMPFHKHAHWTLENRSDRKIDAFYYNIDFTALKKLPAGMNQFHASFRRENPTTANKNYTILDAEGDGQYVGTALFMQAIKPHDIGFLEGDEMIYIDGRHEPTPPDWHHTMPVPQINGTGTEDYFSSGWYFDHGTYSAPYHGCVIKDEVQARISAYRWNIEDAIPFHKNILVTIEHGTNNDHVADYSSVAYFYQSGPHKPYPPLPSDANDLLPRTNRIAGLIDGGDLVGRARATSGDVSTQTMFNFPGDWASDSQLFWRDAKPGAECGFTIHAPQDGIYDLTLYFTSAPDYATVRLWHDNKVVGRRIDLYAPSVQPHAPVTIRHIELHAGDNSFALRIADKNATSSNYYVGLDGATLTAAK